MAHFEIKSLNFSYPTGDGKPSLDGVSLRIGEGEYVVVCGASGSGKTTLLRHLKPSLTPHGKKSGEILFDGKPIELLSERDAAEKIGYVMQDPCEQIVTDKVWHELAFGLESIGCEQSEMRSRVAEMACYFGIQDWFHRDVSLLSGGQRQLLCLASIMAMHPDVLILDEPTAQLDPIAASDFLNTVRKINSELGITVIITEHRLEDILPFADRVVVMDSGKIISDAPPREAFAQLYEKGHPMFSAMPTPVRVFYESGNAQSCPLTVREGRARLIESLPSPRVKALYDEKSELKDEPAVSVNNIRLRYEKNAPDVLKGFSLDVQKGSIHMIVGGNGAGKSTALKTVCGLLRAYSGKIKLFGKSITKYKSDELHNGCVAMLPQDPKNLFVKKSVEEELFEMSADKAETAEVSSLCKIGSLLSRHPYDLSGGEMQRAALAKVLLTHPKLLLLDEPTKGMDSFFKDEFGNILRELKSRGITVLAVSHDIEFCAKYADNISMLFDGQLVSTNTARKFFSSNSFYTTAASRMSRCVFSNAVTVSDVVSLIKQNSEGGI